jgi:acetoin utilization deacetylase AcuC-like enzyme
MTLFITHSACLEHLTPPEHPERPDRIRAIEQALEHEKCTFLVREQCPRVELEIVALCHPWEYIERIRRTVPQSGLVQLDADTVLSAGSFEASLRAAGGAILAVDEVMAVKANNAFVAIRPAGHHAEATTAMGFCIFKCRHCGPSRAATLWRGARCDCRFRCPSRQWLPANFLERSDSDVLLYPRDAALSRYRGHV